MSGKSDAQAWVEKGGLQIYPCNVVSAAQRLLNDDRALDCWQRGFGVKEFENAVHIFHLATTRDAWSGKSQRERDEWKRKFDKTVSQLVELMGEAPTTPEQWGFPARDYVLMNVFHRVGHEVPAADDVLAFFGKMRELETAADAECWTIADALLHYQRQVEIDYEIPQPLKKPRDEKAGRAEFIVSFKMHSGCSAIVVACAAIALFDDNAIDERLVRRLTSGRAGS